MKAVSIAIIAASLLSSAAEARCWGANGYCTRAKREAEQRRLADQRQVIQTPTGQQRGYLETRDGKTTAYSNTGQRLGYYDARSNQTYTVQGRVIARGNVAVTLIR